MSIKKLYILAAVIASLTGGLYAQKQWNQRTPDIEASVYSEDGPFSLSQAVKRHTEWIEKGRICDPDKVEELLHKTRNYDKLPHRLKNTFEQNRDNWYYFPPESGTRITSTSIFNTEYALIGMSGSTVQMIVMKIHPDLFMDGWQQTPAVHPMTKRPYFEPDSALLSQCPEAEQEKLKAVFEAVNNNFHFLMANPLIQLDAQKWEKGDYWGKLIPAQYVSIGKWKSFKPKAYRKDPHSVYGKLGAPIYDLNTVGWKRTSYGDNCVYWFVRQNSLWGGVVGPRPYDRAPLDLGFIDLRAANDVPVEKAQSHVSGFQVDILIQSLSMITEEWPKVFEDWRKEMSQPAAQILTKLENRVIPILVQEQEYLQASHPENWWSANVLEGVYEPVYQHQMQRLHPKKAPSRNRLNTAPTRRTFSNTQRSGSRSSDLYNRMKRMKEQQKTNRQQNGKRPFTSLKPQLLLEGVRFSSHVQFEFDRAVMANRNRNTPAYRISA